jgi:hypothetical protein
MWEFPALPDSATDIKITYSGNVWWHKGLTKHNVETIYYNTPQPRTDQFLRNAGFESLTLVGPWTVTNVQQTVFDSWQALNGTGSSAVLSPEFTIKAPDSGTSAKIVQTRVSGSLTLFQRVQLPPMFRGKAVSLSSQVRQGVGASTRAYIADSAGTTFSATSATTGSFVTLTVTRTIDAAATFVEFGVSVDVSDTVYADNLIANLGAVAASYQPEYWYPGAVTDDMIGWRTPDQTVAAASGGKPLSTLVSMFANRIKAITGTTNWYDTPGTTLAAAVTSLASKVAKAGDTMTGILTIATGAYITLVDGVIYFNGALTRYILYNPVDGNFHLNGNPDIVRDPSGTRFYHTADFTVGNASNNVPKNNGVTNTGLVADTVRGFAPSNASGNIPISNGVQNTNLVADTVRGFRPSNTGASDVIPISNGVVNTGLVAASATTATSATSATTATTAATASNALGLGGFLAGSYPLRASGTYTGNGTSGRQIAMGFLVRGVIIINVTSPTFYTILNPSGGSPDAIRLGGAGTADVSASITAHASDGFVVGSGAGDGNVNTHVYNWVAFG